MSILVLYAHPHHSRSIANRALLDAVRDLPGLTLHSLYDAYPDFAIDVEAERARLASARLVVWQHPLYWYHVPALLALWFEVVLTRGWAFGEGAGALAGKSCLWVTTTGAADDAYRAQGAHGHPFAQFVPAVKQTAVFCGMRWLDPLVLHSAHHMSAEALREHGRRYRNLLAERVTNDG